MQAGKTACSYHSCSVDDLQQLVLMATTIIASASTQSIVHAEYCEKRPKRAMCDEPTSRLGKVVPEN